MAYSEAVLQRAQARLAQARQQHDEETRSRIEAIYAQQPRLRQIDQTLRQTAARIMAVSFRRGEDPAAAMAELKKENLALQQERDWLLESNDIDPDDLSAAPLCPRCGGTGYVGAVMCDCLRELCRQEQKKELSQLLGSGKESFEHFRLDLYPAEYDPKLGASPRKLMQYVYNNALHYARTFTLESGSILMIGATGLGKTFLSACIARTVADRGYSVLYSTAMQLFSDFETAKFARSTESADASRKYFTCDLLIIDDLGTEMTTQFTVSALYQIVNTRLLEGRPTIISTNLPAAELKQRYSPQIASRLLGVYECYSFAGDDIRMLK
ncbi:putative DNA replication protein DnaC [Firmicutes bacterium CAG:170]|nr:putative DNA replication protein DnaC [Firmicutes bacterium CAG:170]